MIYLVASLASMIMLAASLSVIYLTVRASHGRIVDALLGQSTARPALVVRGARPRASVKAAVRRPLRPLRAAA